MKTFFYSIIALIIRIIIVVAPILVFLLIANTVLHFGQEIWHSGSNQKIEQIESEMATIENVIKDYERKGELRGLEDFEYNVYESLIEEYNILVDEVNELREKTGTRYYIK